MNATMLTAIRASIHEPIDLDTLTRFCVRAGLTVHPDGRVTGEGWDVLPDLLEAAGYHDAAEVEAAELRDLE